MNASFKPHAFLAVDTLFLAPQLMLLTPIHIPSPLHLTYPLFRIFFRLSISFRTSIPYHTSTSSVPASSFIPASPLNTNIDIHTSIPCHTISLHTTISIPLKYPPLLSIIIPSSSFHSDLHLPSHHPTRTNPHPPKIPKPPTALQPYHQPPIPFHVLYTANHSPTGPLLFSLWKAPVSACGRQTTAFDIRRTYK